MGCHRFLLCSIALDVYGTGSQINSQARLFAPLTAESIGGHVRVGSKAAVGGDAY